MCTSDLLTIVHYIVNSTDVKWLKMLLMLTELFKCLIA